MSVRSELESIMTTSGGLLKVETVHDWAVSHPKSALHKELLWDDQKAGLQYRFWQIRQLIAVHVRHEKRPELRKFISLSKDRTNGNGGGYRNIDDVIRSESLREVLLADALQELERVQAKYDMLSELTPVWREVSTVRSRTRRKKGGGGSEARPST